MELKKGGKSCLIGNWESKYTFLEEKGNLELKEKWNWKENVEERTEEWNKRKKVE